MTNSGQLSLQLCFIFRPQKPVSFGKSAGIQQLQNKKSAWLISELHGFLLANQIGCKPIDLSVDSRKESRFYPSFFLLYITRLPFPKEASLPKGLTIRYSRPGWIFAPRLHRSADGFGLCVPSVGRAPALLSACFAFKFASMEFTLPSPATPG